MERYLMGVVAVLLFGAVAAFLGYIPIVPLAVTVLILACLVLMFLLGLYVGANSDLRFLTQTDPTTNAEDRTNDSARPTKDSTKLAA